MDGLPALQQSRSMVNNAMPLDRTARMLIGRALSSTNLEQGRFATPFGVAVNVLMHYFIRFKTICLTSRQQDQIVTANREWRVTARQHI